MRVARALFRYAAGRYQTPDGKPIVTFNPVQRLSATKAWNNLERRRGYIKAHELPAWWAAVQALPNRIHADFLTFLICTGVRLNEARNLVWSDVDLRGRTFSLHDTKARRPVTFPLSTFLCDMLARRQAE
ncbi:tyrosine-type recombinase/integrase, partial [Arthrospira platensis SPKY1]|nr:tyrosine-type recombinase/integrase [Arthrospira platensis SPKY1]